MSTAQWRDVVEFDHRYLSAVKHYGSGDTPIFGMRLMWDSVSDLSNRLISFYPSLPSAVDRLSAAFGAPLYFHLSREDKVAQAVSLHRAEQSGLWHVFADGTERERLKPGQPPVYDAQQLSMLVAMLEEHDAAWSSWFAEQQLEPVRIKYEDLSTEPQAALTAVLGALGLDPVIAGTVQPGTRKLSDSESSEWAARFRTESIGDNHPTYHGAAADADIRGLLTLAIRSRC